MSERSAGWLRAVEEMLRKGLAIPDAELREDDDASTCKPVKIHRSGKSVFVSFNEKIQFSPRGEAICIKDRLFPLFQEADGVARMCDYWILHEERSAGGPVLYVFLCELKSGRASALVQLENALLLAQYFLGMVGHHRGLDGARIEYRGLVFSPAHRSSKAGLRPRSMTYATAGRLQLQVAYLSDHPTYHLSALCA